MEWLQDMLARVPWTWALVVVLVGVVCVMKMPHRARAVTIFGVAAAFVVFVVVQLAEPAQRWGCVLALLPAALILQHAVFLRLVRMPFSKAKASGPRPGDERDDLGALQLTAGKESLAHVFAAAQKTSERYFSSSTLAVRYGTPAVAVALVGIVVYYLMFTGSTVISTDIHVRAAQLGVAGAYVYVLLYLGQRNFRHDVTGGGAMWCGVVLAIGPVLAWALSQFMHGDPVAAAPATSTGPALGSDALYFAAGLAPRHVTSFVEEAVRRLWVSPSGTNIAAPRTIPITQVRGITPGIAERLSEEGILDLYGLATADPLRLIRNTNFDKRQLISWIDEAILIATLPDHWQALEKDGFTGAIDLVWLHATPEGPEGQDFAKLAARLKLDDVSILVGVVKRLHGDPQLRLIWVLYQYIDRIEVEFEDAVKAPAAPATA
jgi:hypothetical protein